MFLCYNKEGLKYTHEVWKEGTYVDTGGLALDNENYVYITGTSDDNLILLKYSPQGQLLWTKKWGSGEEEFLSFNGFDLVIREEDVYITGYCDIALTNYEKASNILLMKCPISYFSIKGFSIMGMLIPVIFIEFPLVYIVRKKQTAQKEKDEPENLENVEENNDSEEIESSDDTSTNQNPPQSALQLLDESKEVYSPPPNDKKKPKEFQVVAVAEEAMRLEQAEAKDNGIGVEKPKLLCVVHKGPIKGSMYVCPSCETLYCQKCAKALQEKGERCWSCGSRIQL